MSSDFSKFLSTGDRQQVSSFSSRVTRKGDGRFDVNFFSMNKRYRSMIEVGRHLGLVKEHPKKKSVSKKRPSSSRDAETEKRKLRKELEKLSRAHQKATKALDDFQNDQSEKWYPVDDDVLSEELALRKEPVNVTPTNCPAARVPDVDGFPGVPDHCVPDALMVWDFLCTFSRALSLNPIQLDDFVAALTFTPPDLEGDGINPTTHQPPVYIAEAHLGLLKLLLQDRASDDWWWSILDTDETSTADEGDLVSAPIDDKIPVIKVDFAALLAFQEDPLITASWLQALEGVRNLKATDGRTMKQMVKTAASVAANAWVKAYLKKSLTDWKPNFAMFTKRAVVWLVDRVREARPELTGRKVNPRTMLQQRAAIVDQIAIMMERMDGSGGLVAVDDIDSDEEEDESDDESDDENVDDAGKTTNEAPQGEAFDEDKEPVKSAIPKKPPPTLVDLLLPPSKPLANSDAVSSFSWPHLAAASVCRILHSYKRMRNEIDDKLRDSKGLPPMSVRERKQREAEFASRVLTECATKNESICPIQAAASHLGKGGHYLELSTVERLCLLKTLVDAAYDSARVREVVDSNYKQRFGAVKAVDAEERRAKREAREEAAIADRAARDKLASEASEKFLDEKREELRKLNQRTNEYSDAVIDELTDEDIIDFDEDSRAEYAALPTPQSFNKTEVNMMVKKMQEEAAFDTHSVIVISLDEIRERDEEELRAMEDDLKAYDDVDVYELGREGSRRLDRLRREVAQVKESADTMPEVRASAMDMLKEAIEDGTVKSLKAAIRVAKQAKLSGNDSATEGVWAINLLRDAALELKSAERRKRVIEAKKDLVAKMNKCFIRTEPLGRDRFRNSFWNFESDGSARVWVEAQYVLENGSNTAHRDEGYVDLVKPLQSICRGAEEKESDMVEADTDKETRQLFRTFSRKEFHRSGESACLAKRYWGGHAAEKALKGLTKNLDDRGIREHQLKGNLKEALEQSGLAHTMGGDQLTGDDAVQLNEEKVPNGDVLPKPEDENDDNEERVDERFLTSGDEEAFRVAVLSSASSESSVVSQRLVNGASTGIGTRVRVRQAVDPNKQPEVASYLLGVVVGWKQMEDEGNETGEGDGPVSGGMALTPVWQVVLDRGGGELLLTGAELIESICRFKKWKSHDKGYFEHDAVFLSYRNALGRHCGKAADAGFSATPMFLSRLMVRREQELYTPLKNLSYDNNWGGKSGARNAWIASMRDECYDFRTAMSGLLTLENAFFELTGGFPDSMALKSQDPKSVLADESLRFDVELESIEKEVKSLWNSRLSREIFHEIIRTSSTTGFLALALDLLCRNGWAFVDANGQKARRSVSGFDVAPAPSTRTTRRMNAWQQANQDWF